MASKRELGERVILHSAISCDVNSPTRPVAEYRDRLAEQPAQLLDRHRLHVVLREVRIDRLGQRQRAGDPSFAPEAIEFALKRILGVLLGREPSPLRPARATPGHW